MSQRWTVSLVLPVLVLALVVSGAGYTYAAYSSGVFETLPPGTTVGGVDVSGMSRAEAVQAVRPVVERNLDRKATVRVGEHTYTTTPAQLGVDSNIEEAVAEALRRARQDSWWKRLTRSFEPPTVDVTVGDPSRQRVEAFVDKAVERASRPARNASLELVGGEPRITKARRGRRVDATKVRRALLAALADGKTHSVRPKVVEPEVTADAFDTVLVVVTGDNELRLYKNGNLARTFSVATGMPDHPTPHGRFEVTLKRPHPTWVNPAPNGWGSDLPARIGPGADNPLGLRALNISSPGIRIHGTSAVGSIGYNASHGCIRLTNSNILQLYPRVPAGATVFIIDGGPPRLPPGQSDTGSPRTPLARGA